MFKYLLIIIIFDSKKTIVLEKFDTHYQCEKAISELKFFNSGLDEYEDIAFNAKCVSISEK